MDFSAWTIAVTLSKLLIYIGTASAIGGTFIRLQNEANDNLSLAVEKSQLVLISLGIIATVANFFLQVGAFAEEGWSGMLDQSFIKILWQTSAGDSTLYRIIALVVALLLTKQLSLMRVADNKIARTVVLFFYALSVLLLGRSFSLIGHTAELPWLSQLLLSTHLLLISWWMGTLWPLYIACSKENNKALFSTMERFGQQAAVAVSILFLCGLILSYQMVGTFYLLFTTEYGINLLIKLTFIGIILFIAVQHKLVLVPQLLKEANGAKKLAVSIKIEIIVGLLILVTTSILTTMVGPSHG